MTEDATEKRRIIIGHRVTATTLMTATMLLVGCGGDKKNPSGPSFAPHGPVEVNALKSTPGPWKGRSIDPSFAITLEANAKAGPVRLILADMDVVPDRMTEAGFVGREPAQYYALSRSYADFAWVPGGDGDLQTLSEQRDEISAWWQAYIDQVIAVMRRQPSLTVLVILNDGHDRTGGTLGLASRRAFPAELQDRVELGDIVPD